MTPVDTGILHHDHLIADKELEHRDVEHIQDLLDVLLAHPATHTKTSDLAHATMARTGFQIEKGRADRH